ncbi:opsin-5-like [Anguilla anguilla]|uniref:opsin-5-like n=1 Tax=Anguilla anguilla TaxID=7936 RepID=UPI0015ABF44F|nr:opsin-5-like [Anguilla anguilla]
MSIKAPLQVGNIPWRNNNFSRMDEEPSLSEQGETIIGAYLLILGWLSWFGNSVVIFILYKQRASLLPTDYLTFNLAVSDASISVFGYSRGILEIFNVFRDDGFLISAVWTCQVDGFLTLLFGLASINTLTVISVTRYIKGCHPNRANCVSRSTVSVCLVCIWLAAAFWSGAPLLGWGSYVDRGYGTCEIDWTKSSFSTFYKSYIVSILVSCFFIPVLVMLFSYVSIIKRVKSSNAMSADGYLTDRQRKIERDVTRVSLVICVAFVLAWSPYAAVSMWSAWGFPVPASASVFTRLFAKSASFYNPLIYFGMSCKFRRDVIALLPCTPPGRGGARLRSSQPPQPEAEPACPQTGALSSPRCQEQKLPTEGLLHPIPSLDSGVISPPSTPPPASEEIFCISIHSPAKTPDYQ